MNAQNHWKKKAPTDLNHIMEVIREQWVEENVDHLRMWKWKT